MKQAMRADVMSGLTVAVVALPQSMAYALIAGAPPVFGLYTSIVSCIVGALLGSSRHLITGPTNATAIMFASTLAAQGGEGDQIAALVLYTFLIGVVKFAFGLFRLGRLVNYISDSVIIGFTAGAGVLIVGNQIKHVLGVTPPGVHGGGFLNTLLSTFRVAGEANGYTVAIAVGAFALILILQRINRRIPSALVACVAGAVVVYALGFHEKGVTIAGDIGTIRRQLPPFGLFRIHLPDVERMIGGAVAVAVIGLMEVTAISKSIAVSSGQRLDSNRDFMAQGMANMVGAFFSNFAASGSFIRSSLNYQSGAKTRLAGVFSGLLVAVAVVTMGPWGEYIPIAALAGLLMLVAVRMIDRKRLALAWRAGAESRIVLVVTILATLTLRIDHAIYLGVFLSLAFFIRQSTGAHVSLLLREDGNRFREVPIDDSSEAQVNGEIVVVNVIGAMYFGSMDEHQRRIMSVIDFGPRAVVLRLRRVVSIDSSGLAVLETVCERLRVNGIPLVLCGVDEKLGAILRRSGLIGRIGSENVIASRDLVFNSIEASVALAESLAKDAEARLG
ncbi:MAG: STAS domain-containing protein [Nitrospiraceae bacterium]|nr:STAS domain-containing protein [Nitrospiraceae bacterium]